MTARPSEVILYIEDDPDVAGLLHRCLAVAGYHGLCAEDAATGLHQLAAESIDLVLVDCSLPDMDGLSLLKSIAARWPHLPCLMVAGVGDETLAIQAVKRGARDYLIKDSTGRYLDLLPGVIGRELEQVHLARENSDARRALEESEARFQSAFRYTPLGMVLIGPDGCFMQANPAIREILGLPETELVGLTLIDVVHEEQARTVATAFRYLMAGDLPSVQLETRLLHRSGREVWVALYIALVKGRDDSPLHAIAQVLDITRRRQVEESLRQMATVFENTGEGVLVTDPQGVILAANRAFSSISGYGSDELVGRRPTMLRSGRHAKAFYEAMWSTLINEGGWQGEINNRRKDGEVYSEWVNIRAVRDLVGEIQQYVAVYSDISVLKAARERFEHLAHHDPLTGLPNRLLFNARLDHALERAQRSGERVAVLFIDLDRFKPVNDTLGHEAGDDLLKQVSERLRENIRRQDTVARLGGDEFTLLLEEVQDRSGAERLARDKLDLLCRPFILAGRQVSISASIGIALFPDDGDTPTALVQVADRRMYQAKRTGRNACIAVDVGPDFDSISPVTDP